MATDQLLNNVTQTLINVSGGTNIGTSLPPRQIGEFRVPFVTNLRIGPIHAYLGGTQYVLLWDEPGDTTNVSHYNVFITGALDNNKSPLGPYSTKASPASLRVVTNTATVLTFFVQTQLSNGNVSDLSRSPSVTSLSVDPTISGTDIGGLPAPTPTTLGGVTSLAPAASNWINSISTLGVPSRSQPAFTDISGVAVAAQIPTLTPTKAGLPDLSDAAGVVSTSGNLIIGGQPKFAGTNSTGAASAALGANSPATIPAAPYTWIRVTSADGTTCYIPAWK